MMVHFVQVDVYSFGVLVWEVVSGQSWYRTLQRKRKLQLHDHDQKILLKEVLANKTLLGTCTYVFLLEVP